MVSNLIEKAALNLGVPISRAYLVPFFDREGKLVGTKIKVIKRIRNVLFREIIFNFLGPNN